jgi:hypothetical protein
MGHMAGVLHGVTGITAWQIINAVQHTQCGTVPCWQLSHSCAEADLPLEDVVSVGLLEIIHTGCGVL